MDFKLKSKILITCFNGLSSYLKTEIECLGFKVLMENKTAVETEGTMQDAMFLNLHIRTGLNVMFLLKDVYCRHPDQLNKKIYAMPWNEIIPNDEYLSVVSRVNNPNVNNTMFVNVKVKDAIVDKILNKTGKRPDSGSERENIVVNIFWKEYRLKVYLNTSGRKTADRGYRRNPYKAPLREPLAAAIMLQTGYNGSQNLICPMCGSGTLAIEAALIALNKAPGFLRDNFAFMHLIGFNETDWQKIRKDSARKYLKKIPGKIVVTDKDTGAIEAAESNAMTAGVRHLMEFQICDFFETPVTDEDGIVIMNPEYGKRLGEEADPRLAELYARIGDFLKQKCAGYTGYIFTGNMDMAKKIGLKTDSRTVFWNAKIECRLLEYQIYKGKKET
ncbi:MAG: THUMP domain-containing class I SAM-dependent RNA methyltransferase [Planctomycetota bacterium]|jgi:putative N6-adenine-specific DNA methylase